MSSAKTERLVNLTMALLGSKRFMSKNEIFRRVAGYTGSQETKERMFERDKDDLRELGIDIEVGGHDPLFGDESGYRIRTESYRISPEAFTAEELGIIATALSSWEGSSFGPASRTLLRRINSLGISPSPDAVPTVAELDIDEARLLEVAEGLARRTTLEFEYQKSVITGYERRRVNPLGLCAWRASWYLVGEDLDRNDVRVFKLARFLSTPKVASKPGSYEIPRDFSISDYVMMYQEDHFRVTLKLRAETGLKIRNRAIKVSAIDAEWDQLEVDFGMRSEAIREVLWLGDEVVVLEPTDLREEIVSILKNLVNADA